MNCQYNETAIRQFYQRLQHEGKGYTEIAIIDPVPKDNGGKGIVATGCFSTEDDLVKACLQYNGQYNVYAGRNPRPEEAFAYPESQNQLDSKHRRRAKDIDIEWLTAISLDIDPANRQKGQSATDEQVKACIDFAVRIRTDYGGMVDMTGNGSYFWAVVSPIPIPRLPDGKVDEGEMKLLKAACKDWQEIIVKKYDENRADVRIDGCFDLSRVKKVIGTLSVKGQTHRLTHFVSDFDTTPCVRVYQEIMNFWAQRKAGGNAKTSTQKQQPQASSSPTNPNPPQPQPALTSVQPHQALPAHLLSGIQTNPKLQKLWNTPDPDHSKHDWALGMAAIEEGITDWANLRALLEFNPHGKYQRDSRDDYLDLTVDKLLLQVPQQQVQVTPQPQAQGTSQQETENDEDDDDIERTPETPVPILDIDKVLRDKGFLRNYMDYTAEFSDASRQFHLFAGLSALSAGVGNTRFVWYGDNRIYPNLWVILVAASTRHRKSSTLNTSRRVIQLANDIIMEPVMINYQAEIEAYEQLPKEEKVLREPPEEPAPVIQILPDAYSMESLMHRLSKQASGIFIWSEWASAVEAMERTYNTGRATFTDLYDREDWITDFLSRRDEIKGKLCLSILAASTLDWIVKNVTERDLHGGFLARFVYIPSIATPALLALPPKSDKDKRQSLAETLVFIHRNTNDEMSLTDEARRKIIDWTIDNDDLARQLPNSSGLASFYDRLPAYLIKFGILLASDQLEPVIEGYTIDRATPLANYVRDSATYMVREQFTFSEDQAKRKKVLDIIKAEGKPISQSKLTRYAHMKVKELHEIVSWLLQEKSIVKIKGGKGGGYKYALYPYNP